MAAWFGNMKTMWKLMLGFALMGLVVAGMGAITSQGVLSIREQLRIVYEDYTVAGTDLALVANNLNRTRTNDYIALDASTKAEFEQVVSRDAEITELVNKPLEAYAATILRVSKAGRDETNDLKKFRDAYAAYVDSSNLMYETIKQSWNAQTQPEAEALRAKARAISQKSAGPKMETTLLALNELLATVKDVAKDMNDNGAATVTSTLSILTVGTIAVIAIGLFLGWLIARFLSHNLNNVVLAAKALGGGDLGARSSVATKDEVGVLAQSFNEMGGQLEAKVTAERVQAAKMEQFMVEAKHVLGKLAEGDLTEQMTHACEGELDQIKSSINTAITNLTQTITTVMESAQAVTVGCEETNRRNEDFADRTAQQAASLEQTASSMEEMTATVKQSADSAVQAKQLAAEASSKAESGSRLASQVRDSMEMVTASAQKIEGITTLIDDIATQTNKLAVDAGAGASRAGAQGRGFGIVAQEVRSLAQRSATAAREIKTLIEEFRSKLLDRRAGDDSRSDALQGDIVTSVNKISDIAGVIDEIALQTNMLAINAAVEAAGAGAHGQNFSAVVTEIRDLAARSAAAGRDIKGLISVSIQSIEKGNTLSSQSATTLQEIEQAVATVSRVVGQIATASQEQANGIEQVNKAVSQMDQTTQQNAALIEESTSASQLMTEQARELIRQVELFKTNASEGEKAAMPQVIKLRENTAKAIHDVYVKTEPQAVRKASRVKGEESESATKCASRVAHPAQQEPVGVAAGNGKDRQGKGAEFEEF